MKFATAKDLKSAGLTKNKIRKLVKQGKLKISHGKVKETGQIVKIYTRPEAPKLSLPKPAPLPEPEPKPQPVKLSLWKFISKWWARFWRRA